MKMNKWYFISFGVLALVAVLVIKFALPYLGLLRTAQNLTSGDADRIAQSIDFDSLRASLLEQYRNNPRRGKAKTGEEGDAAGNEDGDAAAEEEEQADGADPSAEQKPGEQGAAGDQATAEPVALPLPVENSTLNNVIDPLLSDEARQDARVQAMLNDALSPDGISRLLNGEMTQYNDLAREVFPPHLVEMAMRMTPEDARALISGMSDEPGPDGTRILAVDMPNDTGRLEVTLRQNGSSYQIVDMKLPTTGR